MSARSMLLAAFALGFVGTACQPPVQEAGSLSEEDMAAIKSIGPAVDQAALVGDWGAVVAVMTEDGLWMPPNSPAIQGRATMKAWLESLDITMTERKIELLEIDGHGDIAYARGTYAETFTVGGVPEPIENVGKNLSILRKQPDGSWLIAVWIWNSDLPPPEPESATEE
ncbi:MAG: DUF4440 domain-containing protein [Acidobacteriota bacterium]